MDGYQAAKLEFQKNNIPISYHAFKQMAKSYEMSEFELQEEIKLFFKNIEKTSIKIGDTSHWRKYLRGFLIRADLKHNEVQTQELCNRDNKQLLP